MRGVVIESGLEIAVTVAGDAYSQGEEVVCSLSVKNRNGTTTILPTLFLGIAQGIHKKVKAKDQGGFNQIASALLSLPPELPAGGVAEAQWSYTLDRNAVVSEKNQSLYVLFGAAPFPPAGQLPLSITPHKHIDEVFRTLEMVFQFIPKGLTWKDGFVIGKFKPPSSRDFTLVEELNLGVRRDGENLTMQYRFKVKKFESSEIGVQVKKGGTAFDKILPPSEYLFGGGFFNQERVEASLLEALSEVRTGF